MLQILMACATILLIYNLLLLASKPAFTPTNNDGVRNRVLLERFFDRATPPVVIVGSSVSARVAPDFIRSDDLGPYVYNLSLLGEGASTGIEAILRKRELPRVVLVDPSFGDRSANKMLLEQLTAEPSTTLRRYFPAFRIESRPVDILVSFLSRHLRSTFARAGSVPAIAGTEPEPAELAENLAYLVARNSGLQEERRAEIDTGLDALGKLIDSLQQRNVRVVLVQFPAHPTFAATVAEKHLRQKLSVRFPSERYEWLDITDSEGYRTLDGIHLTHQSARRLAEILRDFAEGALR